jgi:hypothetical protein
MRLKPDEYQNYLASCLKTTGIDERKKSMVRYKVRCPELLTLFCEIVKLSS